MEADSSKPKEEGRKVPDDVNTVFAFSLPYAIPISDGNYVVKLGNKNAIIKIKRIQRKDVAGFTGTGTVQMRFDKFGRSSFSAIFMEFPWRMNLSEEGRRPVTLGDVPPKNKAKEGVLRFLNRFIETVRYITQEYWVEPARYQDLLAYEVFYWDGKTRYPAQLMLLDTGVGGIGIGTGNPFQISAEKLGELNDILSNELPLETSRIFLLNSRDACLQEDFRLAVVEAVTALEIALYRFIRIRGEKLKIPKEDLENSIKNVGLTGNIIVILRMLTENLEQPDETIVEECRLGIRVRNKILHEGLREVSSTETENRIVTIEKMVDYLNRLIMAIETSK